MHDIKALPVMAMSLPEPNPELRLSISAGRVWIPQGLAPNGSDQPTGVLIAGQRVGKGNQEDRRSRMMYKWTV